MSTTQHNKYVHAMNNVLLVPSHIILFFLSYHLPDEASSLNKVSLCIDNVELISMEEDITVATLLINAKIIQK